MPLQNEQVRIYKIDSLLCIYLHNIAYLDRPVKPKMKKFEEAHKLKKLISKAVNKSVEDEIRARASSSSKTNLSKAQQVVAAYNTAGSSKT